MAANQRWRAGLVVETAKKGAPTATTRSTSSHPTGLLVAGGELVTVLTGVGTDPAVAQALAAHIHRRHPGIEFATYATGHRGDELLIGVE